MLRGLCALVMLLVSWPALAGPVLVVDVATPDRVELRAHLDVLRDPGGRLVETAVRAAATDFRALGPGTGLNFGYTTDAVWLRLVLASAVAEPTDWRIELD